MRVRTPLLFVCCSSVLAAVAGVAGAPAALSSPAAASHSVSPLSSYTNAYQIHKGELNKTFLSTGALAFFDGPQGTGGSPSGGVSTHPRFGSNVDANDPRKDLAPGQSETLIAAAGSNVMVTYNDASGFLGDATTRSGSLNGVALSRDGGNTWQDLIGLPNNDPHQRWQGDPGVIAIDDSHFIVSGLYIQNFNNFSCDAHWTISVSVAHVTATGVTLSVPKVAVDGGSFCVGPYNQPNQFVYGPAMDYDPASRTLVISYSRQLFNIPQNRCDFGHIEMTRAHVPADPESLNVSDFSQRILVQPGTTGICYGSSYKEVADKTSYGGSHPAVAPGGDTYVAYEANFGSNFNGFDPYVYEKTALVPADADSATKRVTVTKNQANSSPKGGVKSVNNAGYPGGYNRYVRDFPRVAWNKVARKLEVVWGDASRHPLGDVYLKELAPDLSNNDTAPIRKLNDDNSYALHFLPAVSVGSDGSIRTSWYDRRLAPGPDSAITDYFGETRVSSWLDAQDFRITTGSSNWAGTSFFISPNYGFYTDNATVGAKTYYAWADGRIGVPQPFVDSR